MIDDELKSLRIILEERIKSDSKKLEKLIRILQTVKGIQLEKNGDFPTIAGMVPMSEKMRNEVFESIQIGCKSFGISLEETRKSS